MKNIYKIFGMLVLVLVASLFFLVDDSQAICRELRDDSGEPLMSFTLMIEYIDENGKIEDKGTWSCIYVKQQPYSYQIDIGYLAGIFNSYLRETSSTGPDLLKLQTDVAWTEYYKDGNWIASKKTLATNLSFDLRGDFSEKRYVIQYTALTQKKLVISFDDFVLGKNEFIEPGGCCVTIENYQPVYKNNVKRPDCKGDWNYLECSLLYSAYFPNIEACYCNIDGIQEKRIIIGLTSQDECQKSRADFDGHTLTECEWYVPSVDKGTTTSGENSFIIPEVSSLNPLGTSEITDVIGRIINTAMQIIGSIALAMFIYGGFLWMTGRGSAEKTKMAMQIMLWAALGVIVILGSYGLVDFVFEAFPR